MPHRSKSNQPRSERLKKASHHAAAHFWAKQRFFLQTSKTFYDKFFHLAQHKPYKKRIQIIKKLIKKTPLSNTNHVAFYFSPTHRSKTGALIRHADHGPCRSWPKALCMNSPRANNTCACAGTCAGMPDDGPGEVPLEGSLRLETQLRLMTQRSLFCTLYALTRFSPLPKANQMYISRRSLAGLKIYYLNELSDVFFCVGKC